MDAFANASSNEMCNYESVEAMLHTWLFLYLLLVPLFLCVAYVAHKQWQKQRTFSHSDIFTFNIVGMEILATVSCVVYVTGVKFGVEIELGGHLFSTGTIGQMCFHCLTCVERYLAVVHPIVYLRLKKPGGVAVRNYAVAGAWGLSVGFGVLQLMQNQDDVISSICQISLAFVLLVVVLFCSIAVLRVLIRPGPGEGGGDLRRIDHSKQRAFVMITVMLGVLLLRFVLFGIDYLMKLLTVSDAYTSCVMSSLFSLLNFPCSLVLPLMFLQKYGKLPKWSIMNCKP